MKVSGVFFDLYGTLLIYSDMSAAWSDWLSAFYVCLKGYGLSMSKESFAASCDLFFSKPEPPDRGDGRTVYERRIQTHCRDLGLDLEHGEIHRVAMATISATENHMLLDPEAIPVLRTLGTKRTLALISNYDHPPHVHALLDELRLRELFAAVTVSGDVGVKKPDPRIFSFALEQTGLQPDEVVYVGDTLADVEGALAAGILPIRICRSCLDESEAAADFKWEQSSGINEKERVDDSVITISRLSEILHTIE